MISSERAAVAKLLSLVLLAPLPLASAEAGDVAFADDFEEGSPGWSASGLWSLSSRASASPTHGWHYAIELADGASTYDTGARNAGELVSPPVELSGMARAAVSFWTRWDGETSCAYEHPELFVERASGARALVWEQCARRGEGAYEADLSAYLGETIRLVFRWDTRDAFDNAHEGWFLDDVAIVDRAPATVQPAADLRAIGIGVSDAPTAGENITIKATVQNMGAAPVGTPFVVVIRVDGETIAERTFEGAAGGQVLRANATARLRTAGEHVVEVVADVGDAVDEPNEQDNARAATFVVGRSTRDIAVHDVRLLGRAIEGWPVTAAPNATLTGNFSAAPAFSWELDGEPVENASFVFHRPLALGTHTLRFVADPADDVVESDETNNVAELTFEVVPASDVGIEILSLEPVEAAPGVPHPLGRHEATLRACNASPTSSLPGQIDLRLVGDVGSRGATPRPLAALAGGGCAVDTFQFDALGAVGTFRLEAHLVVPFDEPSTNDVANATSHRAADAGVGVVVGSTGVGLVDGLVDQTVGVVQPRVDDLVWLANESSRAPASTAVALLEEEVCSSPNSTQCTATHGDPALGGMRPCRAEPEARINVLAWTLWYAVRVEEERGLPAAEHGPGPAAGGWPLPVVEAPADDPAPRACDDHWARLAELGRATSPPEP